MTPQAVARKGEPTPNNTIIALQRARNATAMPPPFAPQFNVSGLNTTASTVHTRAVAYLLSIMVLVQAFVLLFSICVCENEGDDEPGGKEICCPIIAMVYGFIAMAWAPAASLIDAVILCLLSVLALGRLWYPSVLDLRRLIAQWR